LWSVELQIPQVGPYTALVRIETCGICNSTDHKLIEGTMGWAPPFPIILGHESVGRVMEVGPKVRRFKVGDRVTRPIYLPPDGADNGGHYNAAMGGLAEYGIVRDAMAMAEDGDPSLRGDYNALRQNVVPEHLGARDAALAISLAETASVLRHLPNARGLKIVVAGTGVAGLAFMLWFKLAGARVIALGRRAERLQKARELGTDDVIDTRQSGFMDSLREAAGGAVDGLIEATGDAPLAEQILGALAPDGFACAYGVPPTGTKYASRWRTAVVEEHLSYDWVADLLARGWVKPEWFVSHEWEFRDVLRAFEQAARGEVLKGFVTFPTD
jgi:L-iditol 2-dehydrogenase